MLALRPRERPVPAEAAARDYFTAAELDRGRRFRGGQRRLGLARAGLRIAALAALARRPPARLSATARPVAAGAATAAALSAGLSLADLPGRALARERARRVGLVTQGWGGWAGDVAKGLVLETAVAAPSGAVATAGMRRYGRAWWIPAAAAAVAFGVLATTVAPLLVDPLFNSFEPLAEGPLRRQVLALADRAGVHVGEVYAVDASRRTTAANAYVTGLGPTKRVVLFDTLLRDFPAPDVRLVVDHELAHVRFRDVPRGLALMALVAPPGALAVARLGERLAAGAPPGPAALPGLALAGALLAPAVAAIATQLSRAVEVRADRFALELTGDAAALIAFERRVTVTNVIDPQPPALERLLATHPSTMERIGLALGAERGA